MNEGRAEERGFDGRWRVVAACAVGLFAAGTFLVRDPDLGFGISSFGRFGGVVFGGAAAALCLLLAVPGPAEAVGRGVARVARPIGSRAGTPLVVVGFFVATLLFASRTLSGDARSVVQFVALDEVYASNPLTCYLFRLVKAVLGPDPVAVIRFTSSLSGALYAWCAVRIGREVAPVGSRRTGVTVVLLTAGAVAIFFGTLEVYAPLVAMIALFLLTGLRWLGGRGAWFAAPFVLGLAAALHGSAVFLSPALLLLAGRGRLRPFPWKRSLALGLVFLIPLAATLLLVYFDQWGGELPETGRDLYGSALASEDEGPILPLTLSPHDPIQRYALFDLSHLIAILNLLVLYAPAGIALLLLSRRGPPEPGIRFVGASALLLLLLVLFWNVSFSLRRDWDLFSSLGPPLALLGALRFFAVNRPAGDVVRAAALSLFCAVPFVIGNYLGPTFGVSFESVAAEHAGEARFVQTAKDVVGRAAGIAAARGLPPALGPASGESPAARRFVSRVMADRGFFARSEIVVEPDVVRQGLEARGVGPGIARDIAESLARALERARAAGVKDPAPGVLAFVAVRELPGRGPMTPSTELSLLDALDEALGTGPGLSYRRPVTAPGVIERAYLDELRSASSELGRLANPEAWAGVLAEATEAALSFESDADRVLLAAEAAYLREHAATPRARFEAALQRAVWIAESPSFPPRERYLLAERYARQALDRHPDDPEGLYVLAGVRYNSGHRDEGVGLFRRALEIDPGHLPSSIALAIALRADDKPEEARRAIEDGLRIGAWHPRASEALIMLARMRIESGDRAIARSVLLQARRALNRAFDKQTPASQIDRMLAELGE